MAQKVITQLVDDIDGKELKDGQGETVAFSLDGTAYEIDLSNKNADAMRGVFMDYVSVGRKTGKGSGAKKSTSSKPASRTDLADVRAWAKGQGLDVNERGRISQSILDAYDSAK